MINEKSMKYWYVPIEIITLKRWLIVAVIINILLLTVDVLRDDVYNLILGVFGCVFLASLRLSLPAVEQNLRRNISLQISGIIVGIGFLRLISMQPNIFNIWAQSWLIIPGLISLFWISSRPISVWTSRELSTSAVEYGLKRNSEIGGIYSRISAHIILIHFVVLTLIPLIWIFDIAISPGNVLGGKIGDSFSNEHFSKILTSDSFWTWMKNSLIVSIGTCILGLTIAIPAGYAFSRYKFTGRDFSMFSFLLVQMFPGIIILVPYFLVMKTLGLLNSYLGLILAYCVTALPLCVWMLKGFFDTVPRELEEAALLDGCNQFQVFTKVVLPLSLPAVAVTALFSFLAAWNEFLLALTFNSSNDMYTLPVGLASLISSTGQAWGDFAAASLLVSLPVAFLFLFFQKFLIEGLSLGGVKG